MLQKNAELLSPNFQIFFLLTVIDLSYFYSTRRTTFPFVRRFFGEMSEMTGNAEVDGAAHAASAGNPSQYTGRKGSLLTTLFDIVHERIENSGEHAEQQPELPGILSKRQ